MTEFENLSDLYIRVIDGQRVDAAQALAQIKKDFSAVAEYAMALSPVSQLGLIESIIANGERGYGIQIQLEQGPSQPVTSHFVSRSERFGAKFADDSDEDNDSSDEDNDDSDVEDRSNDVIYPFTDVVDLRGGDSVSVGYGSITSYNDGGSKLDVGTKAGASFGMSDSGDISGEFSIGIPNLVTAGASLTVGKEDVQMGLGVTVATEHVEANASLEGVFKGVGRILDKMESSVREIYTMPPE